MPNVYENLPKNARAVHVRKVKDFNSFPTVPKHLGDLGQNVFAKSCKKGPNGENSPHLVTLVVGRVRRAKLNII